LKARPQQPKAETCLQLACNLLATDNKFNNNSQRKLRVMESQRLTQILRGDVLGPQSSSSLQVLIREANELQTEVEELKQRDNSTNREAVRAVSVALETFQKRWGALSDNAKALRLGGGCRHGADKGPNCRRCMDAAGALQGPHAKCEDGLVSLFLFIF
jgi:hypothetical protein